MIVAWMELSENYAQKEMVMQGKNERISVSSYLIIILTGQFRHSWIQLYGK